MKATRPAAAAQDQKEMQPEGSQQDREPLPERKARTDAAGERPPEIITGTGQHTPAPRPSEEHRQSLHNIVMSTTTATKKTT